MSRKKAKKPKQNKPFDGTKITEVWVDEASSLTPGLWADPEPKHTKPVEEPEKPFEYAQGGIISKNPAGIFGDSRTPGAFLTGVKGSLASLSESFQKIGRVTRNNGPIRVMVDSEATISEETLEMILGPQKKQEPLEPTGLAKAVNPKLNNLCAEIELPPKALTVEQHREFIRNMMDIDARAIKKLYYGEPTALINERPGEKESFIPRVVVQVEGRKPHIQQFVDIVRKTNGQEV